MKSYPPHGEVKGEVDIEDNNDCLVSNKRLRRGISENWIIETLNSSDQTVAGYGGRKVANRLYNIGE